MRPFCAKQLSFAVCRIVSYRSDRPTFHLISKFIHHATLMDKVQCCYAHVMDDVWPGLIDISSARNDTDRVTCVFGALCDRDGEGKCETFYRNRREEEMAEAANTRMNNKIHNDSRCAGV